MRFETYSQRDTPDATSGDQAWQGIDMTRDKPLVQPGMLSRGENTRLRTGRVRQRLGTTLPGDFNPIAGFGNYLVGSGVFRDPNGNEQMVVAPAGATYTIHLQSGKDPVRIDYSVVVNVPPDAPSGNNGLVAVEFAQAFDQLIMLRRPLGSVEILIWDGDNTHDWKVMLKSTTGYTRIPNSWNAEPFSDRLIYYFANAGTVGARDSWLMSDIEDPTAYDDIYQAFRTNSAEADSITRIMSYFRNSALIFKSHSIYQATLNPTFPVSITQRQLTSTIGSIGNKMPVEIGGDVIFLAPAMGFYRLSEVIQEQIVTLPLPISEPIQAVVDQINWVNTGFFGCSAALDNYAFLGVSIGGGTRRLNTILVYNTQNRMWESAGDTWNDPTFEFNALHVTKAQGVDRIFALDYNLGVVYLLYEGVQDEMKTGSFTVPFVMETRGYSGDDPVAFKKFGRGIVSLATSSPRTTITAITDGFNEEKELATITKDRRKFYIHGKADFNVVTDDADAQKREDYSLSIIDNFACVNYEDLPVGPITRVPGTAPPVVGPLQEISERLLVRSFGRWVSFRVSNDQGVCEISGVAVESVHASNTNRTAA